MDVAHVRPGEDEKSLALADELSRANPNAEVYGAGDYNLFKYRAASILGVRHRGVWWIFAQKLDTTAVNVSDRSKPSYQIRSAYQIWPLRQAL